MAKDMTNESAMEFLGLTLKDIALVTAMREYTSTHQGFTYDYDAMTPKNIPWFFDMGHKQGLGDVATTSRPPIVGFTKDGGIPSTLWKDEKRTKEAKRLGFTDWRDTPDNRATLADAWIKDALQGKWTRILDGELTVNESGTRGDKITTYIRDKAKELVTVRIKKENDSKPKAQRVAIPTGAVMKGLVDAWIAANPATVEKIRALAEMDVALNAD
jgi:hypothetical protein